VTTIRVWSGYRAAHKSEVLWIVFDGERLDALTYAPGGRTVEWTFDRVHDGRAVVHEVRYGVSSDLGVVYVFPSVVDACARFAAEFVRVDADLARVPECRVEPTRSEPSDALSLTLDEFEEILKAVKEKDDA
jgi:hypothetical protein